MIDPISLTQFAGLSVFNKHALAEYYQHELLDSLFKQKGSEHFSFHGGTAIRIIYGGRRFSEDLDFDTDLIESFDQLLLAVISDMQIKGFELEFRLIHKGAYHCHIKFPKVLKELGLSGYDQEKLLIKVDASPTKTLVTEGVLLHNYNIFRNIYVDPSDIILAKKLITIPERNRPKGRDMYDVTWLWGMTSPNIKYLKDNAGQTLKQTLANVHKYVLTLDLEVLAKETKQFLINPDDVNRILQFPDFINQQLQKLR
jgi:predicted nucleotidyltransferase component of viral defense system